jgi:hypothetical protein
MPEPRILTWDWREQPYLAELAAALTDVSNGTVYLTEDDDECAAIRADRWWLPEQAVGIEVCPDPDGHRREHDGHEVTIRARAEGKPLPEVEGQCPYCPGRLPKARSDA